MAIYRIQKSTMDNLAEAIRKKKKTTAPIPVLEMASLINSLSKSAIGINDEKLLIEGTISSYFNSQITTLRPHAFRSCSSLSRVELTNCITIGSSAFYDCDQLQEVAFSNCQLIEDYAF